MKLNDLLTKNIKAYGFQAFVDYAAQSNPDGDDIIVSTLSPAIMHDMGIGIYYAPVLPRNAVYHTADDVKAADLDVNRIAVYTAPDDGYSHTLIVSRHAGTVDILKGMYPEAEVTDSVTDTSILGRCLVVGTLPPALIQYCHAYKAVTIRDFDYAKDGDLSGDALRDRLQIAPAITVSVD